MAAFQTELLCPVNIGQDCHFPFEVVPMEGVEPTHSHEYQILSLARLPIPPHRLAGAGEYKSAVSDVNKKNI